MRFLRTSEKGKEYDVNLVERVMFHLLFSGTFPMFFISLPFCFVVFIAFGNPDGKHYFSDEDTSKNCRPELMGGLLLAQGILLLVQLFFQVGFTYISFTRAHQIFKDMNEARNIIRFIWTVSNLFVNFLFYFFCNALSLTFWVFFFLDDCEHEEYGNLMIATLVFQVIYVVVVSVVVIMVGCLKINHERATRVVKRYQQTELDKAGGISQKK